MLLPLSVVILLLAAISFALGAKLVLGASKSGRTRTGQSCPRCGRKARPQAQYCAQCGSSLTNGVALDTPHSEFIMNH